jgi:uroporphyrinogen III methyltransferase / synthase
MLAGRRIVITRAPEQACELSDKLISFGAIPIRIPLIQTVPILPNPILENALSRLDTFDWAIFTSANAVRFTIKPENIAQWQQVRIAAVGAKTAEAIEKIGLKVDLIPAEQEAASLPALIPDGHILIPQAEQPATDLQFENAEKIAVYHTVPRIPTLDQIEEIQCGVDAITFASPSAVRAFTETLSLPESVKIVCIGKTTAQVATLAGMTVHAIAAQPSADGLIAALLTVL